MIAERVNKLVRVRFREMIEGDDAFMLFDDMRLMADIGPIVDSNHARDGLLGDIL